MGFLDDIRAQGDVLAAVLDRYGDPRAPELGAVADLVAAASPVVLAGMGSSLSAAYPAAARLSAGGRPAVAVDAGELLHYGMETLAPGSLVVLVSQSGRSAETVALAEQIRRADGVRVAAVVNDVRSPLARLADVVVPMLAGEEATVATKTFVATFAVLQSLVDALPSRPGAASSEASSAVPFAALARDAGLPRLLTMLANSAEAVAPAAERFANVTSLVVVGRGPAYAAAHYGALILSETTAIPAQPMTGGAFRHGPIEIVGPSVGVVVLAPAGRTQELGMRLARDVAALGSPTLLVTTARDAELDALCLPIVPEPLAPPLCAVPVQLLAAELARRRGREPGVLLRASKVTTSE